MKKIIVSVIAIFLVLGMGCTVFAAEQNDWLSELLKDENGNVVDNGNVEQIQEGIKNTTNNNTANNNINANANTNVNENRPTTTPHAGLEDYTGLVFVAVFAASAVYAYKKVKEYNA